MSESTAEAAQRFAAARAMFAEADSVTAQLLELRLSELGPMLLADRLAGLSSRELALLAAGLGRLSAAQAARARLVRL